MLTRGEPDPNHVCDLDVSSIILVSVCQEAEAEIDIIKGALEEETYNEK